MKRLLARGGEIYFGFGGSANVPHETSQIEAASPPAASYSHRLLSQKMRGAHPSGKYCAACRRNIFPHPQLRCVIIFYKRNTPFRATSSQKWLRAGACVPPAGSEATARRAGACVSAASVHYVGTPRQAASQHSRESQHRPHSAELPKPEYTPPPRSNVNQSYRLLSSPAHGRV